MYLKGIRIPGKLALKHGIKPKQSYKFVAPKLALKQSRYTHAKQTKRAKSCRKKLKTCFGRLIRDLDRKFSEAKISYPRVKKVFEICRKIFNQKKSDKNKIYSFHAPEGKCISKDKAHKRYEFGNKVSFATTTKSNLIVGALSFEENLFDGKSLPVALDQVQKLTGNKPEEAFVDKGYRGYTKDVDGIDVYHQGQRRGVTKRIKSLLKRRSRIEPVIGQLKEDHRLSRNYLFGSNGNEINAKLAAAAFNFRTVMRELSQDFYSIF